MEKTNPDQREAAPAASLETPNRVGPESAEEEGRPLRVLLVDDNEVSLRLFQKLLHEEGVDAVTTMDGLEAVALAHAEPFDAMLLDLRMQPISGLEVLRRTRDAVPAHFIVTGYADAAEERRALELGARAVLQKPVDVLEVVRHLRPARSESERG